MTEKNDRNILEALMEGAEAVIDLATESEAVKAVPVVGTAFKVLKGLDDLRSRVLMGKLHKFLSEPALREALEAQRIREEILNKPGRDQEIGEMLFLVLDKVTDMTKPVLLARAYASYLEELIDDFTFAAVAHAIDIAFLRDLLEFLNPARGPDTTLWQQRLAAVGLLEVRDTSWNRKVIVYQETSLGEKFRLAIAF